MPKFGITGTVTRTIVQTKDIAFDIEADDAAEARDAAITKVEETDKARYENLEDQNWELDSCDVELTEVDAENTEPEEDEDPDAGDEEDE